MNFKKLELLLTERNLSQLQLAEKTGISKTSINSWIRGRTATIDSNNIEKIAAALGVPVGYFFDETNNIVKDQSVYYGNNTTVEELVKQNGVLQKQVSDLIQMQLINAESIRNLSSGEALKKGAAQRYG